MQKKLSNSPIKPKLIVIAGPNGSGKTTITTQILKHAWIKDCIYINPDEIAQQKFGDWNNKENVIKAAKYSTELRYDCINKGKSIIFETVFSSQEKVDFLIDAKAKGYFIRLFFVSTNHPSINAGRIVKRVLEGGHDVPISKIIDRYYKSIINCKTIATLVDRMYIYDNSINNEDAKLLFRSKNGKIEKKYSTINVWAKSIFKSLK
jgi:predicted ABC-type ATPase